MMDGVTDGATGEALDRAYARSGARVDLATAHAPSGWGLNDEASAPSRKFAPPILVPVDWPGVACSDDLSIWLRMAQIGESLRRAARVMIMQD